MDEGQFQVSVKMPRGARLQETQETVAHLEGILLQIPEISEILSWAGGQGSTDEATVLAQLVPLAQRSRTTADVMEEIRRLAPGMPGVTLEVQPLSTFGVGGGGAPIQVQLRGDDHDQLAREARRLAEVVRAIPGTREVKTSLDEGRAPASSPGRP